MPDEKEIIKILEEQGYSARAIEEIMSWYSDSKSLLEEKKHNQ